MHERDDSNGPIPGVIEEHPAKRSIIASTKSIDNRYLVGPAIDNIQVNTPRLIEDVPRTAVGRTETESKSLPMMPCSYEILSPKVPAESNPDSRDVKALQSRLASNLVRVMSSGFQNLDISLIQQMVEVVGELWSTEPVQDSLWRWIACLHCVTRFYKVTGFKGDLSTRDKFLETLPEGCPAELDDAFIQERAVLNRWRHERGMDDKEMAKEVVSVLFDLGSWPTLTKRARIDKMTVQFTQDLLAWID